MNICNRKVIATYLENEVYIFHIPILKDYFDEWTSYYFEINDNNNNAEILPYKIIDEKESYFIYEVSISLKEHSQLFRDNNNLSFLIVRTREEEKRSLKIKSNYELIELLQVEKRNNSIIYPYIDEDGNINFYVGAKFLYSTINNASINSDGILDISGVFYCPKFAIKDIEGIKLIATSNLTNQSIKIPLSLTSLPYAFSGEDWFEKLKDYNFYQFIDLKSYVTTGEVNSFNFYLEIDYKEKGKIYRETSKKLKLNQLNDNVSTKRIIKYNQSKISLEFEMPTRSKHLTLNIGEYKTVENWIQSTRNKWVEIRKSKQLLEVYRIAFYILSKVMITDKKLVIFESFHGKQYSDSPRAIYEYMVENNPEYKLVWSADRRHVKLFRDLNLPYERRFSIKWLFAMSRAKFWVTNARLPLWIPKPRKTKYVQTWHGTPLKRLATDMEEVQMPGTNTARYKKNFITEANKWDYLVSPNAYSTKIFRRAFHYDRTIIESGYPRNDYLYQMNNTTEINRLKGLMGIDLDKKIILYAPTWRDNQFYRKGAYKFDLQFDLDRLQEEFGDTHVIALRMHYLIAENIDIRDYEGFVYDFSKYADIRDLYLVSDYLITDYSSVFFDYANLKRPMLFYVYDIEDYRDNLRGFYFDFESKAPGPLVKTTEEIISEIQFIEKNGFYPTPEFEVFMDRFCYLEDGEASKRVVEEVFLNN